MPIDPISLAIGAASFLYGKVKCTQCSRVCDSDLAGAGVPGCSKAYCTPCCGKNLCDTHVRGWASGVHRNGGNCPWCHCEVG